MLEFRFRIVILYGDSSPLISTAKKWAPEYKRGSENRREDPREGCPKSATTNEIIEMCTSCFLEYRRA